MGLHLLSLAQEAVPLGTSSTVLTFAHRELYLSMTAFTCASWLFCMSAMLLRSFRLCSVHPLSSAQCVLCIGSSCPHQTDASLHPPSCKVGMSCLHLQRPMCCGRQQTRHLLPGNP